MKAFLNNFMCIEINYEDTIIIIDKTINNDIWFESNKSDITIEFNMYSHNTDEYYLFLSFEYLLKNILGRYVLYEDKKNKLLPVDFIDLKNKTITFHSNSEYDNILKIKFENQSIILSLSKCNYAGKNIKNCIRIKSQDSDYGIYYQDFLGFYSFLAKRIINLNDKVKIKAKTM